MFNTNLIQNKNMKTRIIVTIIIAFTCGIKSTAQLSLLHRIMSGKDTITYHDALIFDLKGSVKTCMIYLKDESLGDDFSERVSYNFNIQGMIIDGENIYIRDSKNRIIKQIQESSDFFGNKCVNYWLFDYNNGQISQETFYSLEQDDKRKKCHSITTFYYDSKGNITKSIDRDLSEDEKLRRIDLVKEYNYLNFDVKGNWIKREYIDPITLSKCTELRKISYFSDEEIKQDLERKRKRRENFRKSDGVINEAPTFGLG